jgi:hypothetical protein
LLLATATWAQPLRAEPAEEAVRFQYTAPSECPDAATFTSRVRERTQRGRLAEPGELARTFSIDVAADAHGFAGDIAFLDDGGIKVARHLHGEQCDAVVSSLALITALALDATLRETEEPAPAPASPKTSAPLEARLPLSPAPKERALAPRPRARSLQGARVGLAGAYASALHAPDLGLAPRVALLGQLDWRSGFALRLSAHYDWYAFTADEGRRANLRVLGVETSACPWRLRWAELAFAPCATLDLGSLRAEGERGGTLTTAGSKTIVWAAVGAELRAAWEPAGPFWVELHGAAAFPLRATYQFVFRHPTQVAYEVPVLAGAGGMALGVRFW